MEKDHYEQTVLNIHDYLKENSGYVKIELREHDDLTEFKPMERPDSYYAGATMKVVENLDRFESIDTAEELGRAIISIWESADEVSKKRTE